MENQPGGEKTPALGEVETTRGGKTPFGSGPLPKRGTPYITQGASYTQTSRCAPTSRNKPTGHYEHPRSMGTTPWEAATPARRCAIPASTRHVDQGRRLAPPVV